MSSDESSRRDFLKIAGATAGGMAIIGAGAVAAQSGGSNGMTDIHLDGEVAGWQGKKPQSISGTTNPTLKFVADQKVTVTWKNLDGQPHNFQVLDSGGNVLHKTEIVSEKGSTQTTSFTATNEMAQYNCVVHPSSMVGPVKVNSSSDESKQQETQTQTETEIDTETQTQTETEIDTETQTQTETEIDTETQTQTEMETETENQPHGGGMNETAANQTEGVETSHLGEKPPAFNVSSQPAGNQTQQVPETETEQGNQTQQDGNGKAKTGNGKAKTGNGEQS